MERFQLVARSLRGGLTECWHLGALAVVDAAGAEVARIGDPGVPAFMRSSAKPLQAIAMLELGLEAIEIDPADLALICGSHWGNELHTDRVLELLARRQLAPAALLCGPQRPLDEAVDALLARRGDPTSVLHNNCSGKHAGMVLTCVQAGLSLGDYVADEHPLQRAVARTVARFTGLDLDQLVAAVDGCSLPTHRVPLTAIARAYVALAQPEILADEADRSRAERVFVAMTSAPQMVAGPGRFTTRLMEVGGGEILGKEGADGLYAVACRGPRPLGMALKIADGTEVCRDGVVVTVLQQLGVLDEAQVAELSSFVRVERLNRRGCNVGQVTPDLRLELHAAS